MNRERGDCQYERSSCIAFFSYCSLQDSVKQSTVQRVTLVSEYQVRLPSRSLISMVDLA